MAMMTTSGIGAGYAPQGHAAPMPSAQPAAGTLQQASQAFVTLYSQLALSGIVKMFSDETASHKPGIPTSEFTRTGTWTCEDGSKGYAIYRSQKLHREYSDPNIDEKLSKLTKGARFIFDMIFKRTDEMMSNQIRLMLKIIQADAVGSYSPEKVTQMGLKESAIFKTTVAKVMSQIADKDKATIVKGAAIKI